MLKKAFNKNKLYPLYSAVLAASVFLLCLSFKGIIGYGNNVITFGDLAEQYIPFINPYVLFFRV